jgi:predicted MFS family arabinose efflux permease
VLSPSGNEVGPFLAIEQAALAQSVDQQRRTQVFAWYHMAGSLATAGGALACGVSIESLQAHSNTPLQSFRIVLVAYATAGVLLAMLFIHLSAAAEANTTMSTPAATPKSKIRLGLRQSSGIVFKLSGLFALDAFAGGFVPQSIMAYWFYIRFDADAATLGSIFFGANLLAGVSALAATRMARRFGLINTMVFTHVPSNLLLILVPFMPTLPLAVAVLLMRFAISQMDVPTRHSYTAAVVEPEERSAAAGITGVARTVGAALSPALTGLLLGSPALTAIPLVAAGTLKLIYDGLLYRCFRRIAPPEEAVP